MVPAVNQLPGHISGFFIIPVIPDKCTSGITYHNKGIPQRYSRRSG